MNKGSKGSTISSPGSSNPGLSLGLNLGIDFVCLLLAKIFLNLIIFFR